jgi:hypothetical protein
MKGVPIIVDGVIVTYVSDSVCVNNAKWGSELGRFYDLMPTLHTLISHRDKNNSSDGHEVSIVQLRSQLRAHVVGVFMFVRQIFDTNSLIKPTINSVLYNLDQQHFIKENFSNIYNDKSRLLIKLGSSLGLTFNLMQTNYITGSQSKNTPTGADISGSIQDALVYLMTHIAHIENIVILLRNK